MSNTNFVTRYGQWALITGATSGIGRAFAYALAQHGIDLVLSGRNRSELDKLARDLTQQHEIITRVVVLDLSEQNASQRLIDTCEKLDIGMFIASAGFGSSGHFTHSDVHEELNMIDVNCRAVTEQAHYFARTFAAKRKGAIVLLSSIVAFQGVPLSATYAATKAYIQTLAEGLYFELKPCNVHVLAVAPGPVNSAFAARAKLAPGQMEDPAVVAKQSLAALGKTTTVRPGFLAKLLAALLSVPRAYRIRIMHIVMAGMTKPHKENAPTH